MSDLLTRSRRSWKQIRDLAALSSQPVQTTVALALARLTHTELVQMPCRYEVDGLSLLARPRDVPGMEDVFIAREYAFLEPMMRSLDDRVVVDVGANVGSFTALVYAHCRTARFLAVEPSPDTAALLRRNVAQWPAIRCEVLEAAVSPSGEPVWFRTEGASVSRRIGRHGEGVLVPSVRLSDLLRRWEAIALLKLDIEGAEQRVLQEAVQELTRVERLVVEVHPDESDARMVHETLAGSFPRVSAVRKGTPGKSLLLASRDARG